MRFCEEINRKLVEVRFDIWKAKLKVSEEWKGSYGVWSLETALSERWLWRLEDMSRELHTGLADIRYKYTLAQHGLSAAVHRWVWADVGGPLRDYLLDDWG